MTVLDCVRARRSVRTFDGRALEPEDARKITEYADGVGNPYGFAIDWYLLDAKKDGLSSPVIVGTDVFMAGKMKRVDHAEEAFGYAFEKVVLFAQAMGVGTTWIGGTMNRSAFEKAVGLGPDEIMPCVSPLSYPAKKMSLRESMMRKGVRADSRMDFGEVFFDGEPGTPLTPEKAGELRDAFEAVRLGPSAVNKQPWRVVLRGDRAHFYECKKSSMAADGMDMQKIDLGIALCHFEAAAGESGVKTAFEIKKPELYTPADWYYIASFKVG